LAPSLLAHKEKSEVKTTTNTENDPETYNLTTQIQHESNNHTEFTIEPLEDLLNLDRGNVKMYEEEYDFDQDFGLVPGYKEGKMEDPGDGVPVSSLDELVDWLDIAGEGVDHPAAMTKQTTAFFPDIQHFSTFNTHDEWPI